MSGDKIDTLPSGKYRGRWTDAYGARKSITLDTYAEVKQYLAARELESATERKRITLGLPPKRVFRDICKEWISNQSANQKSADTSISIIEVHLLHYFKAETALEYIQSNIFDLAAKYQTAKTEEGLSLKSIVNHLTVLSILLNYAYRKKWLSERTSVPKPKIRLIDSDFNYLKNTEEINRFLRYAKEESEFAHTLYAFAIFTGARQGEIGGLKWQNVDFDKRLICIQSSYSGTTKANEVHYVPILDQLLPILKHWKEVSKESDLVFVYPDSVSANKMLYKGHPIFKDIFESILVKAGFPNNPNRKRSDKYICFHDLRHTFASYWVANGGDIFKLSKILGHQSLTMSLRYSHLSPDKYAGDHSRFSDLDD